MVQNIRERRQMYSRGKVSSGEERGVERTDVWSEMTRRKLIRRGET